MALACRVRGHLRPLIRLSATPKSSGTIICTMGIKTTAGDGKFRRRTSDSSKQQRENHATIMDRLGTWDNRLDMPIMEESSIRHGVPIPDLTASKVGVAANCGRRTYMEDRHTVLNLDEDLLLMAVWDGHGGEDCSDFCAHQVEPHLQRRLREMQDHGKRPDLTVALAKVVIDLNMSFERHWETVKQGRAKDEKFPNRSPGTTATIALIRDGYELVVAQVGDSRALLCRDGAVRKMTEDHCPSVPEEMKRIKAAGGFVESDTIGRYLVNGRLAMSRSIGDLDLKLCGVTAAADVRRRSVKHGKDRFLVLITDGITHVLTDKEVVDLVQQCDTPQEAADKLVDQALLFASEDNVTVLVLPLGSWGKGDDKGTSMLYSLGRNMSGSSRFG